MPTCVYWCRSPQWLTSGRRMRVRDHNGKYIFGRGTVLGPRRQWSQGNDCGSSLYSLRMTIKGWPWVMGRWPRKVDYRYEVDYTYRYVTTGMWLQLQEGDYTGMRPLYTSNIGDYCMQATTSRWLQEFKNRQVNISNGDRCPTTAPSPNPTHLILLKSTTYKTKVSPKGDVKIWVVY